MARTYKTQTVAIPLELYGALKDKKAAEHRYGSFNSYVCEILDRHVRKPSERLRADFVGFEEKNERKKRAS